MIFDGRDFCFGNTKGIKKAVLLETFNYKCFYCGRRLDWGSASQDHLIPKSKWKTHNHLIKGTKNSMYNLVLSCKPCNKKKGNNLPKMKTIVKALKFHKDYKLKQQKIDIEILNKARRSCKNLK
jgi:5-methylcytosine-specific restriction endonuclease McrA